MFYPSQSQPYLVCCLAFPLRAGDIVTMIEQRRTISVLFDLPTPATYSCYLLLDVVWWSSEGCLDVCVCVTIIYTMWSFQANTQKNDWIKRLGFQNSCRRKAERLMCRLSPQPINGSCCRALTGLRSRQCPCNLFGICQGNPRLLSRPWSLGPDQPTAIIDQGGRGGSFHQPLMSQREARATRVLIRQSDYH